MTLNVKNLNGFGFGIEQFWFRNVRVTIIICECVMLEKLSLIAFLMSVNEDSWILARVFLDMSKHS